MTEKEKPQKTYDLEERTFVFARDVRAFVKNLHMTVANMEDAKQLVRASGSVGANYIEANDSLSKKDFILRIKICRKEAKESRYWLRLMDVHDALEPDRKYLMREAGELMNIFGAILNKANSKSEGRNP